VVRKQLELGVDIPNNGEQQRDSFVLCLKNRLSGLGGTWNKIRVAERERYPEFIAMQLGHEAIRPICPQPLVMYSISMLLPPGRSRAT
jgi:hypothetical protein